MHFPEIKLSADRRAMKQIVLNLLSNAVKFTNDGGRIAVRTRRVDDAVMLIIADTGIGIPKSALGKIGQPFEQVQSQYAKAREAPASGLRSHVRSRCCIRAACVSVLAKASARSSPSAFPTRVDQFPTVAWNIFRTAFDSRFSSASSVRISGQSPARQTSSIRPEGYFSDRTYRRCKGE